MYAAYVSALQLTREPTREAFHVCSVILLCERELNGVMAARGQLKAAEGSKTWPMGLSGRTIKLKDRVLRLSGIQISNFGQTRLTFWRHSLHDNQRVDPTCRLNFRPKQFHSLIPHIMTWHRVSGGDPHHPKRVRVRSNREFQRWRFDVKFPGGAYAT